MSAEDCNIECRGPPLRLPPETRIRRRGPQDPSNQQPHRALNSGSPLQEQPRIHPEESNDRYRPSKYELSLGPRTPQVQPKRTRVQQAPDSALTSDNHVHPHTHLSHTAQKQQQKKENTKTDRGRGVNVAESPHFLKNSGH